MIVCHCTGTTDRDIAHAIAERGACSSEDVMRSCGAGEGCRGCRPMIVRILHSLGTQAEKRRSGPHRRASA